MASKVKNILAVLLHPKKYLALREDLEREAVLGTAGLYLSIEEPTVWDVDKLHGAVNMLLAAVHDDPCSFSKNKSMKSVMALTMLKSKFTKLQMSRDDVKQAIEKHNFMASACAEALHIDKATYSDVLAMLKAFITQFYALV